MVHARAVVSVFVACAASLTAGPIHFPTKPPHPANSGIAGRTPLTSLAPDPPSIHFSSGADAKTEMDAVTNAVFSWTSLSGCTIGCNPNQTLPILGGPDNISISISSPATHAYLAPSGISISGQTITLAFSSPVAGVGLDIEDGYRFNWLMGLEAFDLIGNSLGKIEETGFNQVRPPDPVFNAAIATGDLISSIRLYTNQSPGSEAFLNLGNIQLHEAPEPASEILFFLALLALGLFQFGQRRAKDK